MQSEYRAVFASQEAQLSVARRDQVDGSGGLVESAGAERADVVRQPARAVAKYRDPPRLAWARAWNWVVAPTEITFGSVAGEPMVFAVPASPVDTLTTTPALTAASSNSLITSWAVSGSGLAPNDSFSTLTLSVSTA